MLSLHLYFNELQWTPLNGITLGLAKTDTNNGMITISEYTSYTEYAVERQLGLDQH